MSRINVIIVVALSLIIGAVVYWFASYKSSSLVIEAKTLQAGRGTVRVNGDVPGETINVGFNINDATGKESIYPIELPAIRLTRIDLAPLASRNDYSITRITLSNDAFRYSWDDQGTCIQTSYPDGTFRQDACGEQAPKLSITEDMSVVITSIPGKESSNSVATRIVMAAIMALYFCCSGMWLLMPCAETGGTARVTHYAVKLLWLAVITLYVHQFYLIWHYAVDVPFYEEWEYFKPQALSDNLMPSWLFGFSNMHRIVFTKLLAWLSYRLTGLNFTVLKLVNYVVFGLLLLAIVRFKNLVVGRKNFICFPAVMIFMLSPIVYENHVFSYQSQIHLVLLFSIITLDAAYQADISCKSTALFLLGIVAVMFTFSVGLGFAVVYVLCRTVYIIAQIVRLKISRHNGLLHIALSWLVIVVGFFLWFHGYVKPEQHPPNIYPDEIGFWNCFLNLVSLGFGVNLEQAVPGIVFLFLAIFPVILLLKGERRWHVSTWRILTALLGILFGLAIISVGRGNLIGASKSSRYAEFAIMLIPYVSIAWWLVLKERFARGVALTLLWVVCLVCYSDDWSTSVYHDVEQMDLLTRECIERYTSGEGDGACPVTYHSPIGKYIDRAKELNVSFVRPYMDK